MIEKTLLLTRLSGIVRYSIIMAISLVMAACGGSDDNNKGNEDDKQGSITSVSFNSATLETTAGASETKQLASMTTADIKVNNKTATAEQFKNIVLELGGINKALFNLEKDDSKATLTFNKADRPIADKTCANNICIATITAKLGKVAGVLTVKVTINDADPTPAFTVTSLGFNAQPLTDSVAKNAAKVIYTFTTKDVQINKVNATDAQFKALTWALSGTNANLFSIDKDNGKLTFNAASAELSRYTCANNQCAVTISASLGGKQAKLTATVSVDPVAALAFAKALEQGKAGPAEKTTLVELDASSFTVNGQAASTDDFANISFSLDGTNKDLFTINKTDASAALVFNSSATALTKTSCNSNICTASLTATLAGQTANADSSVKLVFPVKVKVSDLTMPASHYFIMPGTQYCLRPKYEQVTGVSGAEFNNPICVTDNPSVLKDSKPSIPLVLLLVRDEGQTCIVTKADHTCDDPGVTADTATLQQRQEYLNKYALTAAELESLKINVAGYADTINSQAINKPACQTDSATTDTCKLFINKPGVSSKNFLKGDFDYNINGRFSVTFEQSNYFDAGSALAKNIKYVDDYNADLADEVSFKRKFVRDVMNRNPDRLPPNPRHPLNMIPKLNFDAAKLRQIDHHPYKAHQTFFATRYQNARQPLLVLNNDYPHRVNPNASLLSTSGGTKYPDDTPGFVKVLSISNGLVEGDRITNTVYPLTLNIKGENTLNLNIGILSIPQEFDAALKAGTPANSGRPVFEVTKYKYPNPLKLKCNGTSITNELRKIRAELTTDCAAAGANKKHRLEGASMPAYFGFEYDIKTHYK